jgi:hypothetical protein
MLPILNGQRTELLDHLRPVAQLCGLARGTARGRRDSIDHAPGQRDDVINAAAGALTSLIVQKQPSPVFGSWGSVEEPRGISQYSPKYLASIGIFHPHEPRDVDRARHSQPIHNSPRSISFSVPAESTVLDLE